MPDTEELAHIFREGAMSDGSWWDALGLKAVWDAARSAALEEAAQEAEKTNGPSGAIETVASRIRALND